MKVLATGLTGFVGKNLHKFINDNKLGEVIPINFRKELPDILPVGDALIHLAGKAHDLENASNPDEYFQVNYEKTRELFDLFLASEIKDFIYFSSVKAVADTVSGPLIEEVIPAPKTPYGQSKLKAEEYLLSKKLPSDKRLFILRPCMIHGPGNKGNLNLLYKVVKKGIPYPLGAFENKRSFLSIDNLLFVVGRLLVDPNIKGGIYNVADDRALSTNHLIKVIAKASHCKGKIWKLPKGLVKSIAKMGDVLHLPLNSERLKKLTESYVVSNSEIKQVLEVEEFPVSAEEGLTITIRSFH